MGANQPDSLQPALPVDAGGPARVLRRRLWTWAAAFAALLVGLRVSLSVDPSAPEPAVMAAAMAFCGCAGLGASVYCFSAFILSREVRHALTAAAFYALCAGSVTQTAVDLSGPSSVAYDWVEIAGWLMASVAFASAAHTTMEISPPTKAKAVTAFVVSGVAILSLPLVVMVHVRDAISIYSLNSEPDRASIAYAVESAVTICTFLLVILSLVLSYRRYVRDGDRTSGIVCFFFVPCVFALLARTASATRFDEWWVCSQVLSLATWSFFVIAVGVENAYAHKEARDRLEEMESMHQVSWSLVGATSLRDLLDLLAQTVKDRLCAKVAAVYLADETRQTLTTAAVAGPEECLASVGANRTIFSTDRRPGIHSGHTVKALVTREVQIRDDVFVDVEFVPWRMVAEDNGSAVSLPLVGKNEAMGVLNVYFQDHAQLTQQRLKLLMTIAAAASPAIEYARAREAEQEQVRVRELDRAA